MGQVWPDKMNGPNREEPSSSRTVTLGLSQEVASAAGSLHVTSKPISCFPITTFLYVAQGGDRGPAHSSLSSLKCKELGLLIQVWGLESGVDRGVRPQSTLTSDSLLGHLCFPFSWPQAPDTWALCLAFQPPSLPLPQRLRPLASSLRDAMWCKLCSC